MTHSFVSVIPDKLEDGILYICLQYNTALHKCACGCGEEVVTPLAPNQWKLIYNGESCSLHPSIGNWSYKCKSHYWIRENKIAWAEIWSEQKIKDARKQEAEKLAFRQQEATNQVPSKTEKRKKGGFLNWLFKK